MHLNGSTGHHLRPLTVEGSAEPDDRDPTPHRPPHFKHGAGVGVIEYGQHCVADTKSVEVRLSNLVSSRSDFVHG